MKRTYIQPSAQIELTENELDLMVIVDSDPGHGVDDGYAREREELEQENNNDAWKDGLW